MEYYTDILLILYDYFYMLQCIIEDPKEYCIVNTKIKSNIKISRRLFSTSAVKCTGRDGDVLLENLDMN